MKIEEIIKLMEAAQATDFDTFELEDDEFFLKLERNQQPQVIAQAPMVADAAAPLVQQAAASPAASAAPQPEQETAPDQDGNIPGSQPITSPLVGIFHELPGGKAIKIGDKLKAGDVVCMVEAMKLMNEIQMPEDGEIVWVAPKEGDTVEYEQLLFSYKKA